MLQGKNILIVEDDPLNRVVYTVILKKEGCNIEFDRWGRETIAKLGKQKYDLVILDLMLPYGDSGFTIFEQIRQMPEYNDIPIIAISASEPAVAIPRAKELGFNGYITKPLDKNLFPRQIASLLEGETIWYAGERY
jgi:CheY-like chemotaxis protein